MRDFLPLLQNASLCFSSPKRPDRLSDPLSLLFSGYQHYVSGIKGPGLAVHCMSPSDAGWAG